MECKCNDWKENIEKVSGPIILQTLRGHGPYTGKGFTHCPWCGSVLIEKSATPEDQ